MVGIMLKNTPGFRDLVSLLNAKFTMGKVGGRTPNPIFRLPHVLAHSEWMQIKLFVVSSEAHFWVFPADVHKGTNSRSLCTFRAELYEAANFAVGDFHGKS